MKGEQNIRIGTEIHDYVINNLDDYGMKEERVRIETEIRNG